MHPVRIAPWPLPGLARQPRNTEVQQPIQPGRVWPSGHRTSLVQRELSANAD